MARPPFNPDVHQARMMRELAREKKRIAAADLQFSLLMKIAKHEGIPIEHIARSAGVTVRTVYSRLARLEELRQTDEAIK